MIPRIIDTQTKLEAKSNKPGINHKTSRDIGLWTNKSTIGKIIILWAKIYKFLKIILYTCMTNGIGSCLIMDSAPTNTVVASVKVEEIVPQIIKPAAKKGKKSDIGDLNNDPKIIPIQPIITPVEIVIQKGPKVERL